LMRVSVLMGSPRIDVTAVLSSAVRDGAET
jgi:hypothetical protein